MTDRDLSYNECPGSAIGLGWCDSQQFIDRERARMKEEKAREFLAKREFLAGCEFNLRHSSPPSHMQPSIISVPAEVLERLVPHEVGHNPGIGHFHDELKDKDN